MSIKTKILTWFFLLGIIPAILIGVYYGFQSERLIEKKVLSMSAGSARQTITGINDRILYIEKTLNTSIQNDAIMETLDRLSKQDVVTRTFEEQKIANHFNAVAYNNPYVRSIALLPNETETVVYGEDTALDNRSEFIRFFLGDEFRESKVYKDITRNPNKMSWTMVQSKDEQYICLVKNFSYFLYAKPLGVIVFIIDSNAFEDYLRLQSQDVSSYVLTQENINITTMDKQVTQIEEQRKQEMDGISITETKSDFIMQGLLSNGWKYENIISKRYLYEDIHKTRSNIYFFIMVTSIIFLAVALMMSSSIGNRIKKLIRKFRRLETGDFTVDVVLTGKDEMVTLETSYNKMLVRLAQVIDQSYVYQLEKKEAQLIALQYQINPHFLYNILEVINSMAATNQSQKVCEVTQNLGKLYRYNMNSSNKHHITLRDEIANVENYVYLQNIQMSDRLKLFYDIEEAAWSCELIQFVLQPIAENSIKHGFAGRSDICCMEITAHITEDHMLNIEITDDGKGIEPDRLKMINQELDSKEDYLYGKKIGIGLRNVHARIRLEYGMEYGVILYSEVGNGTVVNINIPIKN